MPFLFKYNFLIETKDNQCFKRLCYGSSEDIVKYPESVYNSPVLFLC